DGDVALEEVEARLLQQVGDAFILHVHAVHIPVGGGQDALRQVMADESVDAEDQYPLHFFSWTSRRRRTLPSPHSANHSPFSRKGPTALPAALRPVICVRCTLSRSQNAPGKGGATARTRSWISCALRDQSMRPSSGRRRP